MANPDPAQAPCSVLAQQTLASTAFHKYSDAVADPSAGAPRRPLRTGRGPEFLGKTALSLWERGGPRQVGVGEGLV
jgi:hypothetical protein